MTIRNAHAKTCRWLLKDPCYLEWLDPTKLGEHYGFLWIKGKPGAGKSTLMKFILTNARKTSSKAVIAFFFNARGEDLEKSTIGAYRSLLLQLLERIPTLKSIFDSLRLSTLSFSTALKWEIESLKMLIEQAVMGLGEYPVVCFIDALDECEEQQIRDMIQFFEHISELAVSNGIRFRICFSSRHYPHITLDKGLGLVLERQEGHAQDIANYLETELKIGKSKIAQQIRTELRDKASGVFMWVILVTGILNKEHDRGQMHALQKKLKDIPNDLHKLFRDILARDSYNRDRLMLCIQWVLFAKQPLSPEQLYLAILSGIEPEAALEWDPDEVTQDVIRLFILDSSKGLAEVTTSKFKRVQFIHESVRDFLLKENGFSDIWPELGSNLRGQSHERLKQCCLTYMGVDVFTSLGIPEGLPKTSSQQATSFRESAAKMFPFLEYAVHNVLYHANIAEESGVAQKHFLNSFLLPQWVKLDNLFERHEVRRHTEHVTFQYMLAEYNMASLLRVYSSNLSCLHEENERYGCALFAAMATGSQGTFQACIESLGAHRSAENYSYDLYRPKSETELIMDTARRDINYNKKGGILLHAAKLGNDKVLAYLIGLGNLKVDLKDINRRTPLWWASQNGCEVAVKLLLAMDKVAINSEDKEGKTPLYVAVEKGNSAVVTLLLNTDGVAVNSQDKEGKTPLYVAAEKGNNAIVTLLLNTDGVAVNSQDKEGKTPLYAAAGNGNDVTVNLLLEKGADVNARGGKYGNALQAALYWGNEAVIKLLLEKAADVNAQGGEYGNALQAASSRSRGHKEIVKLLREKGAT